MSVLSYISSAQQSLNLRNTVLSQKADVDKATQEMSTLRKADIFEGRTLASEKSLEFRARITTNDAFLTANKVLEAKLEIMDQTVNGIRGDGDAFMSFLLTADDAAGTKQTLIDQANIAIQAITNKLNSTYGGVYLFSGNATATRAYELNANGDPVYNGDSGGTFSATIDNNVELPYGIRGDDAGFREMLDILTTIKNADYDVMSSEDYEQFRRGAIGAFGTAQEKVISAQSHLGDRRAVLERKIEDQENLRKIMNDTVVGIEGVTPEEAAVKVEALRVQLQGTYEVTARLAQLSFINYMR